MIAPILGSVFWEPGSPPLGYFERNDVGQWSIRIIDMEFNTELNKYYRDFESNGNLMRNDLPHLRYILTNFDGVPEDPSKMQLITQVVDEPEEEILGWVAYHSDWSDMVTFKNEIDCYRYAVEHRMNCVKPILNANSLRYGKSI